jgi:hypothetical protein
VADGDSYYWAGGEKIPLIESDQVVVDLASATAAASASQLAALRRDGRPLMRSLVLVSRAAAMDVMAGAALPVQPVFRTEDGTLIAVLPEVRVEGAASRLDEVCRSVTGAQVTERTEERLVLVPDSRRGEDALRIANELSEEGGLEVSQARFIRVVARPDT